MFATSVFRSNQASTEEAVEMLGFQRLNCYRVEDNAIHPMKLTRISAQDFDLEKTLDSGQVFHWEKAGKGFVGAIADYAVYVERNGDLLKGKMEGGAPATPGSRELAPSVAGMVRHYFALDHPLADICA